MVRQQIFLILLLVSTLYALIRGGPLERISALLLFTASVLSVIVANALSRRFEVTEVGILFIDAAVAGAFIWLSLRIYERRLNSFDVSQYEGEYNSFAGAVATWYAELHDLVAARTRVRNVAISIRNLGKVSASRLVVECRLERGATIVASEPAADDLFGALVPPAPPEEPESNTFSHLHIADVHQFASRDPATVDPTTFAWMDRPSYGDVGCTFGCQDFRPSRIHHDEVLLLPTGRNTECRALVSVSAADMSLRQAVATIRFKTVETDWDDEMLLATLPSDLARMLDLARS